MALGFKCPHCITLNEAETMEMMIEVIEAQTLDAFVNGRSEWSPRHRVTGFLVKPCGHTFSTSDWVVVVDEDGPRLHERERVLVVGEDIG